LLYRNIHIIIIVCNIIIIYLDNYLIINADLRRALYALFSQFGPILDIHASRNWKMRGQAFIVFKDIASAAAAVRQMGNFNFFEKPIVSPQNNFKYSLTLIDGNYMLLRSILTIFGILESFLCPRQVGCCSSS
jgi:hypothetical protein